MSKKIFKDTKNRLFATQITWNASLASNFFEVYMNRFVSIYSIGANSVGQGFAILDNKTNEVFTYGGTGTFVDINTFDPGFTLAANQTIIFFKPLITRAFVLRRTSGTGNCGFTFFYR